MPVSGSGINGERMAGAGSLTIFLPEIPADWAYWGETPDYAGGALACIVSTGPPTTPLGWVHVPGGYDTYADKYKPARGGDIPLRQDLLINFYTLDYEGSGPLTADETWIFGDDDEAFGLVVGLPQDSDAVSLLDPSMGPDPDLAVPSIVSRVPDGFGNYTIDFTFTMRGTYAVGFWVTGSTPAEETGNEWGYLDSQPGDIGGYSTADYTLGFLANTDTSTSLPWPPGETLDVSLSGTDDDDSVTQIFIFEYGTPAPSVGRKWWVGVTGWG